MKKNTLSSIFVFVTITSILIPLYNNMSTYGVAIGVAVGTLASICMYKYYEILEEEKINMFNKIENINMKVDHAVEQMSNFQEENKDNQKKFNEEFIKRIEQDFKEMKEIKDKTHENLMNITQIISDSKEFSSEWVGKLDEYLHLLNSGQDKFYNNTTKELDKIEKLFHTGFETLNNNQKAMTDKFKENVDETIIGIKGFCTEINEIIKNENERNNNILSDISKENEQHMEMVSTRLGQVTSDVKALFINRIDKDLKGLNEIKKDTAQNLEKISVIIEDNHKFNKEYLENLNKDITDCFRLYNSGQKKFYDNTKNQMDNIKNTFDEMIEDLEDNQEDILKKQSKNINGVLEEMKDLVRDVNNNIEEQSQKHEEEVKLIKTLQDEIINLNQKDMELIKVMLHED